MLLNKQQRVDALGTAQTLLCVHQIATLFCTKRRHGRHLKVWHQIENL